MQESLDYPEVEFAEGTVGELDAVISALTHEAERLEKILSPVMRSDMVENEKRLAMVDRSQLHGQVQQLQTLRERLATLVGRIDL